MSQQKLSKSDLKWIIPCGFLLAGLLCGEIWPEYKSLIYTTLGLAVALSVLNFIFQLIKIAKNNSELNDSQNVNLKDGKEYKIEINDTSASLTHINSNASENINWSDITDIHILAIDGFPIGHISYMLHDKNNKILEIPTDSEGNEALLNKMQTTFENFDNQALIEAMGMLHGLKKLWSSNA